MLNQKWESVYSRGEQLNSWPFTDLVSLFIRYKSQLIMNKKHHGPLRILELGFGAGNNIGFFQSQGIEYSGIEFSETAYKLVLQKFPQLDQRNFKLGSFTDAMNYEDGFDAVIDRGSITCCNNSEVATAIQAVHDSLNTRGLFFGVDWFSKNHSDFLLPSTVIDNCTRTGFSEGQFKDTGTTHFVDRDEILETLNEFKILELTEKRVIRNFPDIESHQFASWNIVAEKVI